jgi:hypothetical protein
MLPDWSRRRATGASAAAFIAVPVMPSVRVVAGWRCSRAGVNGGGGAQIYPGRGRLLWAAVIGTLVVASGAHFGSTRGLPVRAAQDLQPLSDRH